MGVVGVLVFVFGVYGQDFGRHVRNPFVSTRYPTAVFSRLAEIAQLYSGEVAFKNQNVVQFDVSVDQVVTVYVLDCGDQLYSTQTDVHVYNIQYSSRHTANTIMDGTCNYK